MQVTKSLEFNSLALLFRHFSEIRQFVFVDAKQPANCVEAYSFPKIHSTPSSAVVTFLEQSKLASDLVDSKEFSRSLVASF